MPYRKKRASRGFGIVSKAMKALEEDIAVKKARLKALKDLAEVLETIEPATSKIRHRRRRRRAKVAKRELKQPVKIEAPEVEAPVAPKKRRGRPPRIKPAPDVPISTIPVSLTTQLGATG